MGMEDEIRKMGILCNQDTVRLAGTAPTLIFSNEAEFIAAVKRVLPAVVTAEFESGSNLIQNMTQQKARGYVNVYLASGLMLRFEKTY